MILELLPDPTFVIDKNGVILFWNRAMEKFSGLDSDSMIGKGDYEYSLSVYQTKRPLLIDLALHPDISYNDLYEHIERSDDLIQTSYWIEKSGEMRYISVIAATLHDKDGDIVGAIESIRDITSLKKAEEALLVANRKLNLLSGITRHDILNKIMISKAFLSFLEDYPLLEEQKEYIDRIRRSMTEIEQFVAFTKTYQELGIRLPEWHDVGAMFMRVTHQIDLGNVQFTCDISDVFVLCDPLFEKVCYNLIENAIRHGEKLTKIEVTGKVSEKGYHITVEDDGIGIPDEQKTLIFERGYGKNTGYGLFLTREILSLCDITIIETGRYGSGCRFEIEVPSGRFRIGN
ncbi:PAS domain-containing sensor histidine kinase [Methanospirillum sp.]|uniref:PAS domain-containing sensor histidine kinase n=1 Tax=Methanospirillum sp. TaxID=45200 RepID=UPI002B63965F|nr:PAS domain-containing sensor histidine kinase [Methanospirillum sp.]HPP78702.1 PAS domain-containing sensor histidine kinase [Methanospirillum sp.]